MSIEVFVQARMGSTRFPGKILTPILGKPLLYYLVERLRRIKKVNAIRILTSDQPQDDVVEAFCKENNLSCYRGSEDDVLARYYCAAKRWNPEAIIRITSDCPLIEPAVVDRIIEVYKETKPPYDYVSNTIMRTFPRGLDAEIFSRKALEQAHQYGITRADREHVTPYIYKNPSKFRLGSVTSPLNLSHHRWTVDTPEDLALIKLIYEELYPRNPNFTIEDIAALLDKHPEWVALNAHVVQKTL